MSIYGNGDTSLNDGITLNENEREVLEDLILAEYAHTLSTDDYNAFLESEECEALIQEGKISKKTVIKLNKVDDLERRTNMACINLGRQTGSKAFKDYQKYMKLAKDAREKMIKKNKSKATKIAKKAQKEFMKMPSLKVTNIILW